MVENTKEQAEPMLSGKYIAGFLDSDGSISVDWQKRGWTPQLILGFSQKTEQDEVLYKIQEDIGGSINMAIVRGNSYTRLIVSSKYAKMALNRIKKHLVIKRHYAEACLDMCSRRVENIFEARAYLKEQRKIRSLPLPSFPSRKWLAGYIDGDGCLAIGTTTTRGAVTLQLHIACAEYDTEGIEIIHKAFGGNIYNMRNGKCRQYRVMLPPSKAIEILGPIVKHMIVKQDQARLILGCAEMGHYRDGENIKSALKTLKASPHRLNEVGVEASSLMETIQDLPPYWTYQNKHSRCRICGTSEREHCGNGLCGMCYQRERKKKLEHSAHAIVGQVAVC